MNVIRLAIHIGLALHAISIGAAHADPGTNFMFEIQSGQISLQSIEALVSAAAQEEETWVEPRRLDDAEDCGPCCPLGSNEG